MKFTVLCFLLISVLTACAPKPYYYVSGRVVDYKTGKGLPGIYVAFQGFYVEAFFGGPEYFEDLAIDSTDKEGNFRIKVPTAIADSFAQSQSGPLGHYSFALDVRTARSPEWPDLTPHQHILSRLFNIQDSTLVDGFRDRISLQHRTRIFADMKHVRKDMAGITMPFYKGGFIQFEFSSADTASYKNNFLEVEVQQLSRDGSINKQDHTSYDKYNMTELALVPPYVSLNIMLGKSPRGEFKLDTLTWLKNIIVQPGEIKKIQVPVLHR